MKLLLSLLLATPVLAHSVTLPSATPYSASASWVAPTSSPVPVIGYNIYRAIGTGVFTVLNPSVITGTGYTDSSLSSLATYNYYVKSVDATGNQSVPSNTVTAAIPFILAPMTVGVLKAT